MSDDLDVADKVASITDRILASAGRRTVSPSPSAEAGPIAAAPPPMPLPSAAEGEMEDIELVRQELAKKSDPLPESPQEKYRAHARYLNRLRRPERTFYCVFKDCTYRGFAYARYDGIRLERSKAAGGGLDVIVRFNSGEIEEVRIAGQGLRFIASCIGMGIMPWIWELPDGQKVADDYATVISGITITKIERK